MPERQHLSIGEVLSLLREEFPDVTISKIRFLESQGLVDPERTPSGYRKFYDHDVDRLRWILRQQRENFLPLKVIRGRLSEHSAGADDEDGAEIETDQPAPAASGHREIGNGTAAVESEVRSRPEPATVPASRSRAPGPESPALSAPAAQAPAARPAPAGPSPSRPPAPTPSLFAELREKRQELAPPPAPAADEPETYSAEELASASGAKVDTVNELKQYGLITPHAVVGGVPYYDDGALAVTRAAADLARHGVEPRHLRIWRNAADREADLYQQIVLPLLRQRNPQARRQALDTLADLAGAGAALRAALVDRAVRDIR